MFVFAVTQVTVLTAADLTPAALARSVLLFWLIWWAWTQFTWTLNPADTDHDLVRIVTLAATAAAFVMAASVTRAFGDEVFWFVVPYLVVRALGLGLQLRIDTERAAVPPTAPSPVGSRCRSPASCCVLAGVVRRPAGAELDLARSRSLADLFAAARGVGRTRLGHQPGALHASATACS